MPYAEKTMVPIGHSAHEWSTQILSGRLAHGFSALAPHGAGIFLEDAPLATKVKQGVRANDGRQYAEMIEAGVLLGMSPDAGIAALCHLLFPTHSWVLLWFY